MLSMEKREKVVLLCETQTRSMLLLVEGKYISYCVELEIERRTDTQGGVA